MSRILLPLLFFAMLTSSCTTYLAEREWEDLIPEEEMGEIAPLDSIMRVYSFKGAQPTGITVSKEGRIFVNFPRWRDGVAFSVVEVLKDGTFKQYPNPDWNLWEGEPAPNRFTSVQSVLAHNGMLYVLDPANPKFEGVKGNARLFAFDLATNKLHKQWEFSKSVAPEQSYLNDLRIDDKNNAAYITDSGLGAIVVLDLGTGEARRVLDKHPSTKSEDITLKINGKKWTQDGRKPQIHADGIALNADEGYLYYHALTGYTLYRVPVSALLDKGLSSEALGQKVQNLGKTPPPDGMIFDGRGNLYMADLENNAIVYRIPSGEMKLLIQSDKIRWADTFSIYNDDLYFTTSRINEAGTAVNTMVFSIYKVPLTYFVQ